MMSVGDLVPVMALRISVAAASLISSEACSLYPRRVRGADQIGVRPSEDPEKNWEKTRGWGRQN